MQTSHCLRAGNRPLGHSGMRDGVRPADLVFDPTPAC
jgi:hypothetical protein